MRLTCKHYIPVYILYYCNHLILVESTADSYVEPCNAFVNRWCGICLSERCLLPASIYTVAIYLQSAQDGVKTFAPVKSAS